MFDTYIHRHGEAQSVTQHTTVHEHRAPTDASVALLRDMERAAHEKVLQSVRVENTPVECVIHKMHEHLWGSDRYLVILRINGKKVEVDVPMPLLGATEPDAVAMELVTKVARAIALQVLAKPFAEAMRRF